MGEPGRIQAFLGWWRELPTGWRVNVGLYVLAGVSLVALLTQVVVGGDSGPRRVEVAAGRQAPARPTTTAVAPSTTELPPSTVPPLTTAPPATAGRPSPTARAATGGKPAGGGGSPPPVATTALVCERNTSDPRCGLLTWDPPAGENRGLSITVDAPAEVKVNDPVTFRVRVTDPDHLVTGNCRSADFGDGTVVNGPCSRPPCPTAFGVWDTPPRQTGSGGEDYEHRFAAPGVYTVTFTFHTDLDRCPDPYGSFGNKSVKVTVTAPTAPTPEGT